MKKTFNRIIAMLLLMTIWSIAVVPTPFLGKYVSEITVTNALALNVTAPVLNSVFAVYGEITKNGVSNGMALNFYNRVMPALGDTITLDDGSVQTVTEIYTGFDTDVYNVGLGFGYGGNVNDAPWRTKLVESVTVVDEGIAPISTNGWFYFFDTSNSNFYTDYNLTSIDISKLDTSNVTSMRGMFRNCIRLTSLDLSDLDTSNVVNMSGMFYNCNQLLELDISSMDTSSVTNMSRMFASCAKLEKVYVSEKWNIQSAEPAGDMFNSTTKIVGGTGTTSGSNIFSYARIDGGTSAPGYFTYYRYSVVFEANGGTDAPPMMLSNENATENTFTIPQETPVGETAFLGWATTPNADTAEYSPGDTFTSSTAYPCCDILYAVWENPAPTGATTQEELNQAIENGEPAVISGGEWNVDIFDAPLYLGPDRIDFTINDGTFNGGIEIRFADAVINGGKFNIYAFWIENGTLTINGGTFTQSSIIFAGDGNPEYRIQGGTFAFKPSDNYIVDGYAAVDNGDGTWTVVDSDTLDLLDNKDKETLQIDFDFWGIDENIEWYMADVEMQYPVPNKAYGLVFETVEGYKLHDIIIVEIDGTVYNVPTSGENAEGEPTFANGILTIPAKLLTEETKSLVITASAVELVEQEDEENTDEEKTDEPSEEQNPTEETEDKKDDITEETTPKDEETETDRSEDTSNGEQTGGTDEIRKEFDIDTTDLEDAEIKCTSDEDGNAKLVIKANEGYSLPETFIITIGGTEYEIDTTTAEQDDGIVWDSETGTLTIPKDLVKGENVEIGVKLQAIIKEDDDEEADKKPEEDKKPDGDDSTEDTDDTTSGGTEGGENNAENDNAECRDDVTDNSGEDTETDLPVIPPVTDGEQTGGNDGEENGDGTDEGGEENSGDNIPPATEETPVIPPVTDGEQTDGNDGEENGDGTDEGGEENGGGDNIPPATEETPVVPPVTDGEQTGGNNGEENGDGTDEGGKPVIASKNATELNKVVADLIEGIAENIEE